MPPQMAAAVNPERKPQTLFVFEDLFSMSDSYRRRDRIFEVYFTAKTGKKPVFVSMQVERQTRHIKLQRM
jgi:hypothetical protein